jgi:hypothetical protein
MAIGSSMAWCPTCDKDVVIDNDTKSWVLNDGSYACKIECPAGHGWTEVSNQGEITGYFMMGE